MTNLHLNDKEKQQYLIDSRQGRSRAPVLNVRRVRPRVCATCFFGLFVDGSFECQREYGPVFDAGEMSHWTTTCDRWADMDKVKTK